MNRLYALVKFVNGYDLYGLMKMIHNKYDYENKDSPAWFVYSVSRRLACIGKWWRKSWGPRFGDVAKRKASSW